MAAVGRRETKPVRDWSTGARRRGRLRGWATTAREPTSTRAETRCQPSTSTIRPSTRKTSTHRPKGDVLEDSYTRRSWAVLSGAVLCLELALDDGADVLPLTAIAGVDAGEHPGASRKFAGSLRVDGGGAGNRTPVRE